MLLPQTERCGDVESPNSASLHRGFQLAGCGAQARSGATSLSRVQALKIYMEHDIDLTYPVPQMTLDEALEAAFAQRPDLREKIVQTLTRTPDLKGLFGDIAHYVINIQHTGNKDRASAEDEPSSKKRKLEHRQVDPAGWDKGTSSSVADVSFSIPQRKKYNLQVGQTTGIWASSSSVSGPSVEFGIKWESVQDIFCLPVPEKAQAQYNFCIFANPEGESAGEQLLWTVPSTIPKSGAITGEIAVQADDTYKTFLVSAINKGLKSRRKHVVEPTANDFASQIVQAHRKGETAFHVKAFRGSKDGYLFLLSTGILWGFKKPLEFFAFDTIESVSYTSILQRTFNINIAFRSSGLDDIQEFEFSMIDQADFGGIDGYVKRHGLQDASMAEQRRARKLNVNGAKGNEASQGDGEHEEGELEKARREADDLEDEKEDEEEDDENFDPGSEGESEGSGSGSDEDGEEQGAGAHGDMVDEALGSEAESAEG